MARRRNPFKRATRAAAIAGARLWLRPREAPLPPAAAVKKVLVVKLWAVGEFLMATPAFAALRRVYAGAHVTLLTGLAAAPLAVGNPSFDRVWTVPEELFVRKRWGKLRRLRRLVAAEGFDVAAVFHHAWEFALFAAAARIPHRVGFDRDGDGFAHTVKVPYAEKTHQVEEYFELARACGAAGEPGPMSVYPGETAAAEARHLLAGLPKDKKPLVVVAPGGGVNPKTRMEDKRWPADYFVELIGALQSRYAVALVGGEADREVDAGVAEATGVADLTGRTSLPGLYALLQHARAFVGNDSGPMHLAAAAGTPVAAFLGPTDPTLNGPWRTRALVLRHPVPCQPCYRDGYFPPCDHRRCLTELTPEAAAARVLEFLDTAGGRC